MFQIKFFGIGVVGISYGNWCFLLSYTVVECSLTLTNSLSLNQPRLSKMITRRLILSLIFLKKFFKPSKYQQFAFSSSIESETNDRDAQSLQIEI